MRRFAAAILLGGCLQPGSGACETPEDPANPGASSPGLEAGALLADLGRAEYAAAWARMAPAWSGGRSVEAFAAGVKKLPGLGDHRGVRWTRVHYAPLAGNDAAERCLHALVQNVDVEGVLSTPRGHEAIQLHGFRQLGGRWGWNGIVVSGRRLEVPSSLPVYRGPQAPAGHMPLQAPPQ